MASRFSLAARAFAALVIAAQAFLPARQLSAAESGPLLPLTWRQPQFVGEPHAPEINSVVFDPAAPGVALASEQGGEGRVFRTKDGGATWLPLSRPDLSYGSANYRLAYGNKEGEFFAFSTDLYKSEDGGAAWNRLPFPSICGGFRVLVSHPVTPTVLLAGTGNGFAASMDGGLLWKSQAGSPGNCTGGPVADSIAVGVDQPNVVYAGDRVGAWKSVDLGTTWEKINTGLPPDQGFGQSVRQVAVDPSDANRAYALANNDLKVYRTTDGGAHWTKVDTGMENAFALAIALSPAQGNALYATSSSRVYYFDEAAGQWVQRGPVVPHGWASVLNPKLIPDPLNPNRILALYSYSPWLETAGPYLSHLPVLLR